MLLVFDLNHVVYFKIFEDNYSKFRRNQFYIQCRSHRNYIRYGILEFFDSLLKEGYDIAIWTSGNYVNNVEVIRWLKSKGIPIKFFWHREMTELNPNYGIDFSIKNSDTIKRAKKIIKSTVNQDRIYDYKDIIIIDDDLLKVKWKNTQYIISEPYTEKDNKESNDKKLKKLYDDIIYYRAKF